MSIERQKYFSEILLSLYNLIFLFAQRAKKLIIIISITWLLEFQDFDCKNKLILHT
jgi:hypothetical protein